jgi:DNA-directed RNA polymerase specialized sigma24 family protein
LSLWDVSDVEAWCCKVLADDGRVLPYEWDDRLADLIGIAWEASLRFDPAKVGRRQWSFEKWGYCILRNRLVDLQRKRYGRRQWESGNPTRFYSLDADDDRRGLGDAVAAWAGDLADDRDPALSRLLHGGDRQHARDLAELGLEPPRRAA